MILAIYALVLSHYGIQLSLLEAACLLTEAAAEQAMLIRWMGQRSR